MLPFYKVQATGNDFIVLNAADLNGQKLSGQRVQKLCDRHFGIGADGLIVLAPSTQADFRFVYFNADGSRGSMCGNGGRAGLLMAAKFNFVHQNDEVCFLADDGLHQGRFIRNALVKITLNVSARPQAIELNEKTLGLVLRQSFQVDTGVPHVVLLLAASPTDQDIVQIGRRLRHHQRFSPNGTNVNFLWQEDDSWHVRTFERGVEAETLSCGTGITACGLALEKLGHDLSSGIHFDALGGKLTIENIDDAYWLSGGVSLAFQGKV